MATIIVGTNSYIDVVFADAYFSDRYGFAKWDTELNKNEALISAAQHLDQLCDWYGSKADVNQLLEFPRNYSDANPIPLAVKNAQCEIAYNIVDQGAVVTTADDSVTELKAGSVMLKFKARTPGNPIVNDITAQLLSEYGLCMGTGSTKIIPAYRS